MQVKDENGNLRVIRKEKGVKVRKADFISSIETFTFTGLQNNILRVEHLTLSDRICH